MEWPADLNLKIGDYIILKHAKPIEGCLGTDGLSGDEVILTKDVDDIEHCVWQIHVQNQYSAMKEYEDFYYLQMYEQHGTMAAFDDDEEDGDHSDDDSEAEVEANTMLSQLRRAAANENTLNKKLMAMKLGKPLQFGDVFQLCHVQSKKMLTINSTVLAKHERENIRISLHPHGDALSWFEFIPRSKNDREGQSIVNNAEAIIRVHERPSEFIHSARKPLRDNEKLREINCSLESSCWNVCIYQQGESLHSSTISAGQLVSFQEPESSTYLTLDPTDKDKSPDSSGVRDEDEDGHTSLILSTAAPMTFSPSGDCTIGTNLLWQVEKENRYTGGAITSRQDRVSFRHLNSGLFMCLDHDALTAVPLREDATLFEMFPATSGADSKKVIQNNSAVQLGELGRWLKMPNFLLSGMVGRVSRVSLHMSPEEEHRALSVTHSTASLPAMEHDHQEFVIGDKNSATPLQVSANLYQVIGVDLYVGVKATQFLKSFVKSIKEGTLMDDSMANVERVVKTLFSVLHSVLDFLTDQMNNYGNDEHTVFSFDDVSQGDKKTVTIKQTMMREQGVLTQILNIIELCGNGDLEHLPDTVRRRRRRGGGGGKQSKTNAGILKSPTSRQLLKATSTFKTLVGQLSEDPSHSAGGTGTKDRGGTTKTLSRMASGTHTVKQALKKGISRQGSLEDPEGGAVSASKATVTARRNSLLGLKMMQENMGERKRSLTLTDRAHSRMFKQATMSAGGGGAESFMSEQPTAEFQNLLKGLKSISHDISVVCFRTLLSIIDDNHSNQMYIADKFPIILHQIRDQALAVTCVQEMLHDNLQMLQTKVREREINIFLDLLEESEMNVTLLHLLRSTCSCPMGVDSTQRMVAKALLGGGSGGGSEGGGKSSNDGSARKLHSEESKDSIADSSAPLLRHIPPEDRRSALRINVLSRLSVKEESLVPLSHDYRHLLIRVDASLTVKELGVTWPSKSLYLPDDPSLHSSILGYRLTQDGIPRLMVNWKCSEDLQFSMLNLFGFPKDVPYEFLCNITRYDSIRSKRTKDSLLLQASSMKDVTDTGGMARTTSASAADPSNTVSSRKTQNAGRGKKPKRSTILGSNRLSIATHASERSDSGLANKIQVADYFCAQLYLMADMCLDRNYVAMKLVEDAFPYEMLISMLKIAKSSHRFKAPVCRLLKCLYVDRDPQSEAKFPRLIRTSVSLSGGEENSFEDHHDGSPFKFSILQQIISDYIHNELDTTNCDELSAEMVELLLSLVQFGFYSSMTQLQDIIAPLTKALGEHRHVSKKKSQRKNQAQGYDATSSGEEQGGNVVERRNAMPVNMKTADLQTLQNPSLASTLFGSAPFGRVSSLNLSSDDSAPPGDLTTTAGFWESFRKLGKSSVSPDRDSPRGGGGGVESSFSSRLSTAWTKLSAPIAFMSPREGPPPSSPKSPRVKMMKDLKSNNRSARKFFPENDSFLGAQENKQEEKKDKKEPKNTKDGKRHVATWEEKTLQFTESFYFVSCFVMLVLASTAVAIVQVGNFNISFFSEQMQVVVDLVFTIIFVLEVSVRMYCTYKSQHEILSFFTHPLKFVDVFTTLLDVFVLVLDQAVGRRENLVNVAKTLRVLRMFRIIRVVRAARLINTIAKNSYRHEQYVIPERYNTTTEFEVRTITGIIKVMSAVHDRIQDRKLGLCIQYFSNWFNDAIMNQAKDPKEVYAQLCADTGFANAFPPKFDAMLVDVVMYNDPKLTDDALQLLMVHESQEDLFLSIAKQVQIIYSSKLERLYRSFVSDLKTLKSLAESYELWGAAVEDGSDVGPAKNMVEILENLCAHLSVKSETPRVESGPSEERDSEVQQLLFNLDAMSVFISIEHSLLDGQLEEPTEAIKNIIRLCNETIILFVAENEINQNLAFKYFDWFLDRVGDNVGSSRVTKAIIAGNRNLMKQCPKNMLSDFMKNIVAKGRKPEYLDLLVGMTEIVDNGDSGVISLRHEISRSVTNRDRVKYLIEWCDAPSTPGYEERKAAMAPFVDLTVPVSTLDLPVQLQYHINLLTLLSGLKLGQKLQAVYAIEDIIAAILDDNTIFNVRRCLGVLLEELVENKIDGLESSDCIWEYFVYCETFFDSLFDDLPTFLNRDKFHLRFQNAEWIKSTLLVIIHFFDNFDFLVFRETSFDNESAFKVTASTEADIQHLIFNLHHSIKAIRKSHSHRLGSDLLGTFEEALSSLSHLIVQVSKEEETKTAPQGRRASLAGGKPTRGLDGGTGRNGRADEIHEAFYRRQYLTFLEALRDDHEIVNLQAMKIFEKLPSVKDSVESDVRLEYFVVKISSHIRSRVTSSGAAKNLDVGTVTAAKWVLDTWTHLIQKEFGQIALDDLADPQRIVDLPPYTRFQEILNNCGATVLCLDLIAINMDPSLIKGAMKLLVVLLSGSGGNAMVQQTIFEYLYETDSVLFFEQMKDSLEQQMMWCQRKSEMKGGGADALTALPDSILSLKVLSAMCDNFCLSNKNAVREQNGNSRFVNLLDSLASYVDLLSRLEDHACVRICSRVIHTILCFVQGPCKGNQEHFVLHTNLLSALNRIMRLSQSSIQIRPQEWASDIETLKEYAFELLHACIEGQHAGSVVLERVQVAMELNVLNVLIIPSDLDEFGDVIELSELSDLQATYLVFLQNLSSGNQNIEIPLNAKRKIQSDVARIEVIWNRELAVHYFNIPSIALDITMPSKEKLIESVDLSSQEMKLKDFLRRSKDLYGEAVHFQTLKSLGIVDIWNFKHKLSWIMLFNTVVMNVLMLYFFETDSKDGIVLPDHAETVLFTMNSLHIAFAVCILSTYLIVRVPVLFQSFREAGGGALVSFFRAVTDPMPLWYTIYLGVSVLALLKNYLFLSILLLDFIVMDSTSRDIMNAVIYPARQLATTMIIIMISVNCFSGAVFYFFRHDFDVGDSVTGSTLWDTVKLLVTFGVRANEGVGAYMTPNIHGRFILDMFFFLIIVVILMNIFFGIIIDTFGKLRNLKVERQADEANKCFICGVEEHYFLKHSTNIAEDNSAEGFKHHRHVTHDMWNYLYFAMKIWQQPRDLDNSVEMHIRSCMERGDISWFPIGIFNTDAGGSASTVMTTGPTGVGAGTMVPGKKLSMETTVPLGGGAAPTTPHKPGISGLSGHGGTHGSGNNNNSQSVSNGQILQDFSRLEENFTQKLNTLGDNIATLASFSVQHTLDENFAGDYPLESRAESNRKTARSTLNSGAGGAGGGGGAAVTTKKRRSSVTRTSFHGRDSSSSQIAHVADQVRLAMAQAVVKRQEAQRRLADLEQDMGVGGDKNSEQAEHKGDVGGKSLLRVVTDQAEALEVLPPHGEGTAEGSQQETTSKEVSSFEGGLKLSPSSRMLAMMRTCFQQELAPLRSQMDDLSSRVGRLEQQRGEVEGAHHPVAFSSPDPEDLLDGEEAREMGGAVRDRSPSPLLQTLGSPIQTQGLTKKPKSRGSKRLSATYAGAGTTKVHFKEASATGPPNDLKVKQVKAKDKVKEREKEAQQQISKQEQQQLQISKQEQKKAGVKQAYITSSDFLRLQQQHLTTSAGDSLRHRTPSPRQSHRQRVKSAPGSRRSPATATAAAGSPSPDSQPSALSPPLSSMKLEDERIRRVQEAAEDLARVMDYGEDKEGCLKGEDEDVNLKGEEVSDVERTG